MRQPIRLYAIALLAAGGMATIPFLAGKGEDREVFIIESATNAVPREDVVSAAPPPLQAAAEVPIVVPIGSVVAWMKHLPNTPKLPAQWVECNGQTLNLPGSPYQGMTIPDLNGAGGTPGRFLRGSVHGGAVGGSENHRHGSILMNRSGPRIVNVSAWTSAEHLPPYYEVVWIMRVL